MICSLPKNSIPIAPAEKSESAPKNQYRGKVRPKSANASTRRKGGSKKGECKTRFRTKSLTGDSGASENLRAYVESVPPSIKGDKQRRSYHSIVNDVLYSPETQATWIDILSSFNLFPRLPQVFPGTSFRTEPLVSKLGMGDTLIQNILALQRLCSDDSDDSILRLAETAACCKKFGQCFLNPNDPSVSSAQNTMYSCPQNRDMSYAQRYENYKRSIMEMEMQAQNAQFYRDWNDTSMYMDPKATLMETSPYYNQLLKELEQEPLRANDFRASGSLGNSFSTPEWPVGTTAESLHRPHSTEIASQNLNSIPDQRIETLSSSIENLKNEMARKSFMSTSIECLKNEMASKSFVSSTIDALKHEMVANAELVNTSIDALKNEIASKSFTSSAQEMDAGGSITSAGDEQLRKIFDEFEKQIEVFKAENANLVKAKVLYETKLVRFEELKKEYERQLFEKNKAIEDYLIAEKKKLDSEIQKLQNIKLGKNIEFDEKVVSQLKEQVSNLKDEMRKKEDNFKTSQYQIQQELAKLHQECNCLRSKLYGNRNTTSPETTRKEPDAKVEAVSERRQDMENSPPKVGIQKELLQAEKILNEIRQKNKAYCAIHGLSGQKQGNDIQQINPDLQYAQFPKDMKEEETNSRQGKAPADRTTKTTKGSSENWQATNCRLHDLTVIQRTQKLLEEIKQMNDTSVLDNASELDKLERASNNTAEKLKILQKCLALLSSAKSLNKQSRNDSKEKDATVKQQKQPVLEQSKPTSTVKSANDDSEKNNTIYTELQESYQKLLEIVSVSKKNHQNASAESKSSSGKVSSAVSVHKADSACDKDGNKTVLYSNGSLKIISANGKKEKIIYPNGDILERFVDEGTQKYYHAGKKLWVTKDKNGKKYIEYANGQKERYEPDGTVVVRYTDGSILRTGADGKVEWKLADGMRLELEVSGDKVLDFANGQREIHTKDHKRREYPDGTVKYLFPNGTTRTEYANGKVRVKNRNGVIIYNATQAATSTV